jgi:hypothetical protein
LTDDLYSPYTIADVEAEEVGLGDDGPEDVVGDDHILDSDDSDFDSEGLPTEDEMDTDAGKSILNAYIMIVNHI